MFARGLSAAIAAVVFLILIGGPHLEPCEARAESGPSDSQLETLPFCEDFDSGSVMPPWYVSNGLWEQGTPTVGPESPHSGASCMGTDLEGDYPELTDTRLVTPQLDLPTLAEGERIRLTYWHWFHTEHSHDTGIVDISTDNGASWTPVSSPPYEGLSLVWTQTCVDISDYAGSTVRIGFHFMSDDDWPDPVGGPGWYIDDVCVEVEEFEFGVGDLEDFEAGIGDWNVDNGLWEVGAPTSGPDTTHSGNGCAGTVLGGNYLELDNTRLISPFIDLPSISPSERIRLRFWQWFLTQRDADVGRIQVSADTGATWTTVSEPVYEGDGKVWTYACADLSGYAGQTVQVAFYFTSNDDWPDPAVGPGWYVDDVRVEVGEFVFPVDETEGFEFEMGDWSVDNGLWEIGPPTAGPDTARSGSDCAGTVLGGNYSELDNTRLISPFIDLPSVAPWEQIRLRFWHWFLTQHVADTGRVQVLTDTGTVWTDITNPLYEGDGKVWTYACADLSDYAGQTVQVAFYFTSNDDWPDPAVGPGWYIDDVTVAVGPVSLPETEDFESGMGDWSVDNGLWEVGPLTAGPCAPPPSGNSCAGTVLGGDYPELANTRLVSPKFTLTPELGQDPELYFSHCFDTEPDGDFGQVEVSVNGGTWHTVPGHGGPYSWSSGGWDVGYVPLAAYVDSTIQIGFAFRSDDDWPYPVVGAGWFIDDVTIYGYTGISEDDTVDDLPKTFALFQNEPNPFNPRTTISFDLPVPALVDLAVYNVRGQLVRRVVREQRGAGRHAEVWDGRDTSGAPAASGVYFYRLEAGEFRNTRLMVLLK